MAGANRIHLFAQRVGDATAEAACVYASGNEDLRVVHPSVITQLFRCFEARFTGSDFVEGFRTLLCQRSLEVIRGVTNSGVKSLS